MYNITIYKIDKEFDTGLVKFLQVKTFAKRRFFVKLSEQLAHGCYKVIVEKSPSRMREILYHAGKVVVREDIRSIRTFYIFC